jgi:hypothetical protein
VPKRTLLLTLVELGTRVHLGPVRRQILEDMGGRMDACRRHARRLAVPLAHLEG